MIALAKTECRGEVPARKNIVILRRVRRPLAPGRCVALQRTYSVPKANSGSSCRPNLQGRRGTGTVRFDVHNRKIKVKRSC